ncbi:MAG TPA: class I SAM-dependent methyltransferase [Euzebya sp.]|nr:class I SAM-dependent methyltransferase [Euzebya sp.]
MPTAMRHHAYDQLRWNTPLSPRRVPGLARSLGLGDCGEGTVLDLGCGWAQLLVDLLVLAPRHTGLGVDADEVLIQRGRVAAAVAGVADRLELRVGDATAVEETADVVMAIGVSHVWGGTASALAALRAHVVPGGRLLFGDAGWTAPATQAAVAQLGDGLADLQDLPALARAAGWSVIEAVQVDQAEWDDFEERWCAGLEAFAAGTDDPEAATMARSWAQEHRQGYRDGYRGLVGFTYLVLTR